MTQEHETNETDSARRYTVLGWILGLIGLAGFIYASTANFTPVAYLGGIATGQGIGFLWYSTKTNSSPQTDS